MNKVVAFFFSFWFVPLGLYSGIALYLFIGILVRDFIAEQVGLQISIAAFFSEAWIVVAFVASIAMIVQFDRYRNLTQ